MSLPSILATDNNQDLLGKSEKEVFDIIETAVALADWRWPQELHRLLKPFFTKRADSDEDDGGRDSTVSDREADNNPTQRRNVIRIQLRNGQDSSNLLKPVGKTTTATAAPKPAEETEKKPTEGGQLTGVQKARDLDSSDFHKPVGKATQETEEDRRKHRTVTGVKDLDSSDFHEPTTTTVVRKAATLTAAPKRKLEAEEYEKKLENSKSKFRDDYSQYKDSRKRSKITHYIPPAPESNHDRLPNQKKSKQLTTTRRR
ncbi:hypothetical protein LINGRAHAP2_LOCUS34329 [Linum grandiflorum]